MMPGPWGRGTKPSCLNQVGPQCSESRPLRPSRPPSGAAPVAPSGVAPAPQGASGSGTAPPVSPAQLPSKPQVEPAGESTALMDIKTGRIEKWKENEDFGFIRPDVGGDSVYIRANHLNPGLRTEWVNLGDNQFAVGNYEGDRVTYSLQWYHQEAKWQCRGVKRYWQESRWRCRGVHVRNRDRDELLVELQKGIIYWKRTQATPPSMDRCCLRPTV